MSGAQGEDEGRDGAASAAARAADVHSPASADVPAEAEGDAALALAVQVCATEPIHRLGDVQPHGLLLVLREQADGPHIVAASGNILAVLGPSADALAGQSLDALLTSVEVERLLAACPAAEGTIGALPVELDGVLGRQPWLALVHRYGGHLLLELEPPDDESDAIGAGIQARAEAAAVGGQGADLLLAVTAAAQALQQAVTVAGAGAAVVTAVAALTGFGRVLLYRFHPDDSGETVAETLAPALAMASYLGLHFPESDIPAQARALYRLNPVRLIADVDALPAPLLPLSGPDDGAPYDLSFASLRSVSPVHLQYLRNMGVAASMSVSVRRDGRLWGLIACHHPRPRRVSHARRQACVLLAQLLADALAVQDRLAAAEGRARVETLGAALLAAHGRGQDTAEALTASGPALLALCDAAGFATLGSGTAVRVGVLPSEPVLAALAAELDDRDRAAAEAPGTRVVISDALSRDFPATAARSTKQSDDPSHAASGVLAVPLARGRGQWLVWLRPERLTTVRWAGRPAKPVQHRADGPPRLDPRHSFEAWEESVRGRSTPWREAERAAALRLREQVLELLAREQETLRFEHLRLVRSAKELETFLYVAAHDIKDPLRQIEMLASLVQRELPPDAAADTAAQFAELTSLTQRLSRLTDALAGYARLNRAALKPRPVALAMVVAGVLAELRTAIAAAGATVSVGELPVVAGEHQALHQLFANLVGNALKYREPSRACRIEVAMVAAPAAGIAADGATPAAASIAVADNGIGFEERHADLIFDAFSRLHPQHVYPGTGLGLAICRRIVERHGGRIVAESTVGAGSRFIVTLPFSAST